MSIATDTGLRGFRGPVMCPGDEGYERARRVWNGSISRHPAVIAQCTDSDDVAAAVRFARRHGLLIAVRGGGHSIPGHSVCEGGLVIDLRLMRHVSVDAYARTAVAGPGVTWAELDAATQQHGLATPGGEISDTGIAGLTLGGGVGWLSRAYGLSCDNLLAARVVTADGSTVRAAEHCHPDLFWGLRGGGGNFGVVTEFTYRLHPVPMLQAGSVLYRLSDAAEALRRYRDLCDGLADEVAVNAALVVAPPAPFVPQELWARPMLAITAAYIGPAAQAEPRLAPLRRLGRPMADTFGPMPYTVLQSFVDEGSPGGMQSHVRCEWLGELDDGRIDRMVEGMRHATAPSPQVLLRLMGGAVSRVAPSGTAFSFRHARHMLTIVAQWRSPQADPTPHVRWVRSLWEEMRANSAGGGYVNQIDRDEGRDRVREAYGEATYRRLRKVKDTYDPANVFRLNHNIRPTAWPS